MFDGVNGGHETCSRGENLEVSTVYYLQFLSGSGGKKGIVAQRLNSRSTAQRNHGYLDRKGLPSHIDDLESGHL
jgi:hypothetical protein